LHIFNQESVSVVERDMSLPAIKQAQWGLH